MVARAIMQPDAQAQIEIAERFQSINYFFAGGNVLDARETGDENPSGNISFERAKPWLGGRIERGQIGLILTHDRQLGRQRVRHDLRHDDVHRQIAQLFRQGIAPHERYIQKERFEPRLICQTDKFPSRFRRPHHSDRLCFAVGVKGRP